MQLPAVKLIMGTHRSKKGSAARTDETTTIQNPPRVGPGNGPNIGGNDALNSRTPNETRSRDPLPKLAYTMAETAEMLGISYISVHRLIQRGLLRSSRALRHKIISRREIDRFLETTTTE
jgi:hypothetical protein